MTTDFPKARISFQVKILVPVITVILALTATTMFLVNHRVGDQVQQNAASDLATAAKVFKKIQDSRAVEMISKYHNVLNEPRFKAVTRHTDLATLNAAIDENMRETVTVDHDATVATFTLLGENNRVIGQSGDPQISTNEFELSASAAIKAAARSGEPVSDTVRVGDVLLTVVAVPFGSEYETAGVLTYGVRIGSEDAAEIKQIAGIDVVFLTGNKVAASSLEKPALHPALAKFFTGLTAKSDSDAAANPEIVLDRQHYLCQPGEFHSLSGDKHIGYLLLSSEEQALADFRVVQQTLLFVGLLGLALSTLAIWFAIRQIMRPLVQLRDSAEAVGRGDFSKRVEVITRDECGELAKTFNQMTEDVKISRDKLEKTVDTLKATQNQLIQSEKLSGIGEFVAGVAHELNNPLTSVMGFSELLQQGDMPEQQRRYLDVIFKSAKRCQKIVQSLLSFARRHAPERKVVCVNEIVESAVEILAYQMRTNNIEVVTNLDPHLPATELDPHQMQQVFLNIINNARQAIEGHQPKGSLRITTDTNQGRVRITFVDNGPGIPAENIKRIFNPFFTTKEVGKGTGLGLSLCYGIVSEHGGTITPFSNPGEGATFVIELPITHAAPTPVEKVAATPANVAQDGAGKRVLVVDDEDMILQMIRAALERSGYKVDVAHDGEAALRRLGQYQYDLALCDWKMPGLNGQQVFERLRDSNPEMSKRLIFITGDIVNEKTQEFLRAQNKVCLSKPFTLVEFRSAINQVVTTSN